MWSSEEECPQHSFFMGKKPKQQQGPAAHTANQNKVKYYPRVTALFLKVNNIIFERWGWGGIRSTNIEKGVVN